jgi:hypothetical protein
MKTQNKTKILYSCSAAMFALLAIASFAPVYAGPIIIKDAYCGPSTPITAAGEGCVEGCNRETNPEGGCDAFSTYLARNSLRQCVLEEEQGIPPIRWCCTDFVIVCWRRYHPAVPCTGGDACTYPYNTLPHTTTRKQNCFTGATLGGEQCS